MESLQNAPKVHSLNIAWFLALGLIGFLTYHAGIDIPYYGDDFSFYPDSSCPAVLGHFLQKNPRTGFYRPIDAAFSACVQHNLDAGTIPVHLTVLALHCILSYLVFLALLKSGFDRSQAIVGSLFMLLSQANAFAILSNDTLSQVCATSFGCLSLWLLRVSYPLSGTDAGKRSTRWNHRTYACSIISFVIALVAKESSASFFPMALAVIGINHWRGSDGRFRVWRAACESLPYCILFAGYLGARLLLDFAKPEFGVERYDFRLGTNVVKNVGLLLYASVIPASSVTAFHAMATGRTGAFAGIALLTLTLVGTAGYGLWRTDRRPMTVTVAAFALGAMFPMAIMNHVSELYAYNCMPFIAMLVGVGLGTVLRMPSKGWLTKVIAALIAVLFASHAIAVQMKASLMEENGERASRLMEEIRQYVQEVPPAGSLVLVNGADGGLEYSIFLMRDFNVLRYGEWKIKKDGNREDIAVRIVEANDFDPTEDNEKSVAVRLEGGTIGPYER